MAMVVAFEKMSKKVGQEQRGVLRHILQENATCEYLHTLGVGTPAELESMDDRTLEMSSGTSEGREKYLPYFEALKNGTLQVAQIASAYLNQFYPLSSGAKVVEFLLASKVSTTQSGLRLANATTHLIHDGAYTMRHQIRGLTPCCPHEVVLASSMYCHLLCGLMCRDDVEVLTAIFAHTLVEALRMLQAEWPSLCHDIRFGHLNNDKVIDPVLRAAMESKVLTRGGNTHLASQVAAICQQSGAWNGVVKQLWPRCKYVLSIMTGSMETYVETLRDYTGNDVPLVSADYGASEGWIAVNIDPCSPPHQVSFTVIPSLGYFEFLPVNSSAQRAKDAPSSSSSGSSFEVSNVQYAFDDQAMPLNLDEVKLGKDYQILMTTTGGLYRYALGDILRVTGFFHNSPQFAYVCRKNVILNINIDKVTEQDLKLVVQKATSILRDHSSTIKVMDYTSYADTDNAQEHYKIFWEVQECEMDCLEIKRLLAKCATVMDEAFLEPGYALSRQMGSIKALELCIVKQGTFRRLMECFLMDKVGASITQYKTPRCISKRCPNILSILQESTVVKYFSSATF
ncbi:hypothetical protein L7F22_056357 [Adiantum nelumboides]|nr:hypothetical protein [Adiantum nelumboides]